MMNERPDDLNAPWRVVAVDIGGTFTDVVLASDDDLFILKTLSTPPDFETAVVTGINEASERAGIDSSTIQGVVHATTVVTNALLEQKGAPTGLITTAGFRDVLDIARLRRPAMYDLNWSKPVPLVARSLRLEVEERMDADGKVRVPLDQGNVRSVVEELIDRGVESIAVSLLNSHINPDHERQIAEIVKAIDPALHVSLSADILPQIREFERTSTTCVNAVVAPVVDRYLTNLEEGLTELGIKRSGDDSALMLMKSNGGVVPSAAAARRPVALVESGPAAGALAGAVLARLREQEHVIGLDIGGTTAKAFLVENGQLRETGEMEIGVGMNAESSLLGGGGYTVAVPSIDLAEVGAGGGSIARVDAGGALKIGPQSAGSDPGPACYGRGGDKPTVTDAFAVLGFFDARGIAGGSQSIDRGRASEVIREHVAEPLGYTVEEAAWGIHRLNTAAMIRAVRAVTSERGRDPRSMEVLAFGGAGPVQAAEVLQQLGARRVVVPPLTGVFSSFGLLLADLSFDFQKSMMRSENSVGETDLKAGFGELKAEAEGQLRALGIDLIGLNVQWGYDVRYEGQSSELSLYLPEGSTFEQVTAAFHTEHESAYGYRDSSPVELVGIRFRVKRSGGHSDYSALTRRIRAGGDDGTSPSTESVYFTDRFWDTKIVRRHQLSGDKTTGPLIVREYDSTIVVPPGMSACLDELDNVVIEIEGTE